MRATSAHSCRYRCRAPGLLCKGSGSRAGMPISGRTSGEQAMLCRSSPINILAARMHKFGYRRSYHMGGATSYPTLVTAYGGKSCAVPQRRPIRPGKTDDGNAAKGAGGYKAPFARSARLRFPIAVSVCRPCAISFHAALRCALAPRVSPPWIGAFQLPLNALRPVAPPWRRQRRLPSAGGCRNCRPECVRRMVSASS